jgi:ubiquinone/menaquinone biosynthesis C-methylase UbiE
MPSSSHDDVIIDQFTRQAVPFARAHTHLEGMDLIRSLARAARGDTVLDVACGPGLVACAIAPFVGQVTGLDLTPEMIAEARRAAEAQQLTNVEWHVGAAVPLPFAANHFSIVLTRYSFHHFSDPAAAFTEMCRVCRPGDRIVVADLSMPSEQGLRFDAVEQIRDPSHVHVLSREELRGFFHRAGVQSLAEEEYGLDIELEGLLDRSFPIPGGADRIRRAYADDVGVDALGIRARRVEGRIWSTWPVCVMAGTKPVGD